ncbi:MAG: (Fe-S)-binding protein [Burkholderiaceae bacterium]
MIDMALFKQFGEAVSRLGERAEPVELEDAQRVNRARSVMLLKIDRQMGFDLDACVRCGYCEAACQFSVDSNDPDLVPTRKLELLRRVWRRELAPMSPLWRFFTPRITVDELREWQALCYDACTECGRCTMVCPMGIDIARGVNVMRQALASAGLAPDELLAVQQEQQAQGTVFGAGPEQLREAVDRVREQGIEVPLDKPQADVLVLATVLDILLFRDGLAATARVLNAAGDDWTLCTSGYESANFGLLSGVEQTQRKATEAVITQALAVGAKTVIVPECGHAYSALRWEGGEVHGATLPFRVLAISEYIGELVNQNRIRLVPDASQKLTYHDACKLGRHGGVIEQPRDALRATGAELVETGSSAEMNWCCGGGAGSFLIQRAAPLRRKAFQIKIEQIDATGADAVVLSCGSCRLNFIAGAQQAQWPTEIVSLVEYIGAHLER